jgi:protein involved in polysaccharide export with SLBB domain
MMGGDAGDIAVRDGDEIVIGRDPSVVYITGAVERRVSVPYRDGWTVDDYLDAAGGVTPNAARDKVIVEYASGSIARAKKSFWSHSDPPVRSGATITVLEKPVSKDGSWRDTLTATTQVLSVIASLAIGVAALRR